MILLIILITSFWVFFDARRIGVRKGQVKGAADMGPGSWLAVCIFFWIVAFPMYLIKRSQFIRINQKDPKACWSKIDTTLAIIAGLLTIWYISIKAQEIARFPVAYKIIEEKIDELKAKGFDNAAGLIGKGYTKEKIVRKGVEFYLGYVVTKRGMLTGIHSEDSSQITTPLKPGEDPDEVEIYGYVDCVTILPFGYFKMGPSFDILLNQKGEVREVYPSKHAFI